MFYCVLELTANVIKLNVRQPLALTHPPCRPHRSGVNQQPLADGWPLKFVAAFLTQFKGRHDEIHFHKTITTKRNTLKKTVVLIKKEAKYKRKKKQKQN